jgi:retron-type reverse transcriptase
VAECGRHRWVFSGDIRLYFPSIDLTILRQQLAARIACPSTLQRQSQRMGILWEHRRGPDPLQ